MRKMEVSTVNNNKKIYEYLFHGGDIIYNNEEG